MNKIILSVLAATFLFTVQCVGSQDKLAGVETRKSTEDSKAAQAERSVTPLRIQVVFTEYDGDKKVSALPYSLLVNSDDKGPQAAVRMGLRVPVATSANQFTYMDVGTNLDGRADKTEDGKFLLRLNVEKSSLYSSGAGQKPASIGGNEISTGQPIVQSFRSQLNLLIRDGQTIQSTVATDQITGHVLKVEVTLNVIK